MRVGIDPGGHDMEIFGVCEPHSEVEFLPAIPVGIAGCVCGISQGGIMVRSLGSVMGWWGLSWSKMQRPGLTCGFAQGCVETQQTPPADGDDGQAVDVKLSIGLTNTKTRRNKLTDHQLDPLAETGLDRR